MNYGLNKDGFSFSQWENGEGGQGLSIRYRYPAGYIIGSLSNDDVDGYENVT